MLTKEIIIKIEKNFKNVTLDDGIGFFQSLAIDNLIIEDENGKEEFNKEVEKDKEIQKDWHLLLDYFKENQTEYFGFYHMDCKGIRYILPCLLILEYKEELSYLIPNIVKKNELWEENIWNDFLTNEQKNVIIETFKYWNNENLILLKSYGLTEESTNIENEKDLIFKTLTEIKTNT